MEIQPLGTAVILARGLGTRMRADAAATELHGKQAEMAARGMKGMIDIGRPFLDHVISALADAGVTRVCLVIGPEHDEIRDYYTHVPKERTEIVFAIQEEPLGTGDAVLAAEGQVGDAPFLVINSDNYYPTEAIRLVQQMPGCGLVGFEPTALVQRGNIPAERVRRFALLRVDAAGHLVDIIEKPDADTAEKLGGALVSMNCYRFTPAFFAHLRTLTPSPRGEYELTDAVRSAVAEGGTFTVAPAALPVLDLSTRQDIAAVEAALGGAAVAL